MIQLHQGSLLNPRHIAARDAQLLCDLPLRPLLPSGLEPEAAYHDFTLPVVEYIQIPVDFRLLNLQLHLIHDIVVLRPEDVDQRNFIPFLIRSDRVMQRDIFPRLFQRPQVHQDFVFYASCRIGGQLGAFVRLETFNCFN